MKVLIGMLMTLMLISTAYAGSGLPNGDGHNSTSPPSGKNSGGQQYGSGHCGSYC